MPTDLIDTTSRNAVSTVVAIPVRNERQHILACLRALDGQRGLAAGSFGALLFLNNCTDDTEELIATARLRLPLRVVVRASADASAGWARRCGMEAAAEWLDENPIADGVLLTTDADSRVAPDWVARNIAALDAGADAVAGRLSIDADDEALLPPSLRVRGDLEARYEALLMEITACLDPSPGNPWPHHWCRSGASLATRLSTYRRIGGMPAIPLGEDRAFVEAMLAHDLVVRHDPSLVVVTSGRLQGRAKGGVADTIRLRCDLPDSLCDDRLERLERVVARSMLRRRLRCLHGRGCRAGLKRWARALALDAESARRIAEEPGFGRMHAILEASSTRLAFSPLRPRDLPRQIGRAEALVRVFRLAGRFKRPDANAWASETSPGQSADTYMITAPPDVST